MKTPKPILLLCLLVMQLTLSAQMRWYQNQPCKMSRLVLSGNTAGFDTITYSGNYHDSGGEDKVVTESATVETENVELTTQLVIYPNPVQNQLNISKINPEEYDRLTVYNMQGAVLQQQKINTTVARMDISNLSDGVYLLALRSSHTFKEKSIKFVVRK